MFPKVAEDLEGRPREGCGSPFEKTFTQSCNLAKGGSSTMGVEWLRKLRRLLRRKEEDCDIREGDCTGNITSHAKWSNPCQCVKLVYEYP